MTIDYEPGGSTMIRINVGTKKKLEGLRIKNGNRSEGIDDVINRLIQENRKMKRLDKEPVPMPSPVVEKNVPADLPSTNA